MGSSANETASGSSIDIAGIARDIDQPSGEPCILAVFKYVSDGKIAFCSTKEGLSKFPVPENAIVDYFNVAGRLKTLAREAIVQTEEDIKTGVIDYAALPSWSDATLSSWSDAPNQDFADRLYQPNQPRLARQ